MQVSYPPVLALLVITSFKNSLSTKITNQMLNGDGQVTHIQVGLQTDAFTSTMFLNKSKRIKLKPFKSKQ